MTFLRYGWSSHSKHYMGTHFESYISLATYNKKVINYASYSILQRGIQELFYPPLKSLWNVPSIQVKYTSMNNIHMSKLLIA